MQNKKLSDLKPADYNPRKIKNKAMEGLKYSLDEFGDISGIVFNIKTGNLVSAHQRMKALESKDDYNIEIIEQYDKPTLKGTVAHGFIDVNGERFHYREVDWSIEKEKAANIAANSSTIQGEFTSDVSLLLEEVNLSNPDIYSALLFNDILIPSLSTTIKEDDFDFHKELDAISKTKTKTGDIYQLGEHRLLCGDATLKDDVSKLMIGAKAKLIFTDPPYNVNYISPSGYGYESKKVGGKGDKIFNDNKSEKESLELYTQALKRLYEISTDDVTLYWWFANCNHTINEKALKKAGFHPSQVLIWVKNHFVFSRGQDYHRMYEPCFLAWKKGKKHFKSFSLNNLIDLFHLDFKDFIEQFDVWYETRDNTSEYLHPTQKPVRLAERALKKNSAEGSVVVDLFAGSGSTIIACDQMKRRCYAMELDSKFCDAIVIRYLKYKNQTTVMKNGKKESFDYQKSEIKK